MGELPRMIEQLSRGSSTLPHHQMQASQHNRLYSLEVANAVSMNDIRLPSGVGASQPSLVPAGVADAQQSGCDSFGGGSSVTTGGAPPAAGVGMLVAAASQRMSSRWSVDPSKAKKAGIPVSDDYGEWTADQLKAECSAREIKHVGMTTDQRREALTANDAAKLHVLAAVGTAKGSAKARSKHCLPRLLNCMFLVDDIREQLVRSGDQQSWKQLGDRTTEGMWETIERAYNDRTASPTKDTVILGKEDGQPHRSFAGLDPSKALSWGAKKLRDMYTDVRGRYNIALTKFTQSGNHDPDFSRKGTVAGDVVYMYYLLQHYPDTLSFVKGGFPEGAGFNSLNPSATTRTSPQGRPTKALRLAAAKSDGDAVQKLTVAVTGLLASSQTAQEAALQEMFSAAVDKIADWQKKADEAATDEGRKEMEDMVTFYKGRRDNLRRRLEDIELRDEQ
eukprot:GHVU01017083.1.p1 GENE.GHVU01017083.1~~GHVU01017083.1.p1  ORF type:complete len:448 (+),score=67.08 GHVU01017083.1:301-1644(+)